MSDREGTTRAERVLAVVVVAMVGLLVYAASAGWIDTSGAAPGELPEDLASADVDSTAVWPRTTKPGHTDMVVAVSWVTVQGEDVAVACVNTPRGHGYQRVTIRELSTFRVEVDLNGDVVGERCRVRWRDLPELWYEAGMPRETDHGVLWLHWREGSGGGYRLRVETAVPDDLDDGGRRT